LWKPKVHKIQVTGPILITAFSRKLIQNKPIALFSMSNMGCFVGGMANRNIAKHPSVGMRGTRVPESLISVTGFVRAVAAAIAVPRFPDLYSGFE
jgi:hypothetical protein